MNICLLILLFILMFSFIYETYENCQLNIYNKKLNICSQQPLTGFYRDGYCNTDKEDKGTHTVCAEMTKEFLNFTKENGNNLDSVVKPGEKWCLCALRWQEAFDNKVQPKVDLNATNLKTLEYNNIKDLEANAIKT